jgi:hypothetical protein
MTYRELTSKIENSLNQRYLQTTIILLKPDSEFAPEVIKQITYERLNDRRIASVI